MPENSGRPLAAITGASSGLGAIFARKLAARGYDLILVARRRERLEALAAELAATHHADSRILQADLTNEADLARVADQLAGEGRLALLVNNAGFGVSGHFWEAPADAQDKMHRLHIVATARLTHAALGGMVARRTGAIINVSSVAAYVQNAENSSYSASKTWINSFTEGIYLELRTVDSPVRVQALCPGFTVTEFHDTMGADRSRIPGWLWLRAEDVVEDSLRGLDRGELFVVPGGVYKAIVRVVTALPRFLRTPLLIRAGRKSRPRLTTD